MNSKKILLILPLLLVLTGCAKTTPNDKASASDEFTLKQECYNYKTDIEKNVNEFNADQVIEKRGDNDGSFSLCKETQELKEIFYSPKLDSCAHVMIEQTVCKPNENVAFSTSYEYQNLYNTLTGEQLESFKTISRSAPFENTNEVEQKIDEYKW